MLEYSIVFHRTNNHASRAQKANSIDEIFVVPVCSLFADNPHAYLTFLQQAGALDRAANVVAAADLARAEAAEIARREVRSIFTAAEVDLITPELPRLEE